MILIWPREAGSPGSLGEDLLAAVRIVMRIRQ